MNMQDWQEILHRKWIVHGEANFESELNKTFQKFLNCKPPNEEVKSWLEAIPCDFWIQTQNNVLHLAASHDHPELLRYLLSDGYNEVNHKNFNGKTPLIIAIERHNHKAVKLLLDSGATHMHTHYNRNYGPLHIASELENFDIVKILVDCGADVNALDYDLTSPLHALLMHQKGEESVALRCIAIFLIRSGAKFNRLNTFGESPLHLAISNRYFESATVLLDVGASAEMVDVNMRAPLHIAVREKEVKLVEKLVEKEVDVDVVDAVGMSPLCYAIKARSYEMAKMLLDSGACGDIFYVENFDPMYEAVSSGNFELVQLLLSLKPESREDHEFKCLRAATACGRIDMLEKLLANGANITAKDCTGLGLIFYAGITTSVNLTTTERADLLKFLISKGAAVNLKQNEIEETMFLLVAYGDLETVRMFAELQIKPSEFSAENFAILQRYAADNVRDRKVFKYVLKEGRVDIDKKDRNGLTLLHRMADEGNTPAVRCLIKMGADINCQSDKYRYTPLHIAINKKHSECVRLLLQFNADMDVKDSTGNSPLSFAIKQYHPDCVGHVIAQIALLQLLGRPIEKFNAEIISSNEDSQKLHEDCLEELKRCQDFKIHDTIRLFDVMANAKMYSRNSCVIDTLANENNLEKFPIYRRVLLEKFEKVRKRPKLMEKAESILMRVFKCDSNRTYSLIFDNIFQHLRNKDLRNLIVIFTDT